jgi:hypothetical protein
LFKALFQGLLCFPMNGGGLALVWTMEPAWLLLVGVLIELTRRLRIIYNKPATA